MMLSLGDGSPRAPTALPGEWLGMVSLPTSLMVGSSADMAPMIELLTELGSTKDTPTCLVSVTAAT